MKKFLLYGGIGLLVIMLLFGSCGDDTNTTNDITPTIEATQSITATPTEKTILTHTEQPTAKPTEKPTPKPTEKPTEKPTAKPTAKPTEKPQDTTMVWVTEKGKKYHSHSNCSNMKSPYQISKQSAINSGRSACSKCY